MNEQTPVVVLTCDESQVLKEEVHTLHLCSPGTQYRKGALLNDSVMTGWTNGYINRHTWLNEKVTPKAARQQMKNNDSV